MKKNCILYLIVAALFNPALLSAQYTDDHRQDESAVPPGMEAKRVHNDVTVLMPQGGKMYERNKSTFVEESSDEYAARKFLGVEDRLDKLEEENADLAKEIKYLKIKIAIQESGANRDAPKIDQE